MPDSLPPLFFHEADISTGATVRLSGEEAEHAGKSLRLASGDLLRLVNGEGRVSDARVVSAKARQIEVLVIDSRQEPPPDPQVWLGAALIRGPRYEFIVEKATELGVAGIIPLITRFTEIRPEEGSRTKLDRWKRLAIAAMKQSQRSWLPEISPACDLEAALAKNRFDSVWVADPGLVVGPPTSSGPKTLLLVGPEGGWHAEERSLLNQRGASFISLGHNRLRSETAAIALLVLARAATGEMGAAAPSRAASGIA